MISIRVPLRISLFGGGSDLPSYFNQYGGFVVGFTINRYIYIHSYKIEVNPSFKFRLSYKKNEDVKHIDEIKHPIFREVLREQGLDGSYHFTTMSCLPAGSGLGSSSAFTVGFCYLLNELSGRSQNSLELAQRAINIERNVLAEAGGWQDQLHSAFGGVNSFEFLEDGTVVRKALELSEHGSGELNSNMYILYSGILRQAKVIEEEKVKNINDIMITEIKDLAREGQILVQKHNIDLSEVGRLLNDGWNIKKSLSKGVSSSIIDDIYALILKSGAYGAKLCGAGGGGFFMVLANPKSAEFLRDKLPPGNLSKINIDLDGLRSFNI